MIAPFTPLPVEPAFFTWRGHQVATYTAGAGDPLLLVHSINAAASAFEMRGPFLGLQDRFEVHALDLLGYGRSDRPARRYIATDYISIIEQNLTAIGRPTSLIASSLGAAYAIAAAARRPELVRSLVLVCPTGISQLAQPPGPIAMAAYNLLRGPIGRLLFQALTSRIGTRYFLKQQAYAQSASITDAVVDAFYRTSHQPGALYAPICFLTGLLNCDIAADFTRLNLPILLVWGRQAGTTPLSKSKEFLARNRCARLAVIDNASLMAQDEHPEQFNALVRDFVL